jgi:ornithine cyclodeaminase/alanine dehydrogenase-like protein (mu-crystallin family)
MDKPMEVPPLLYLDAEAVAACMPDVDERIRLARRTLTALVRDAELPTKVGVHPPAAGAFTAAMPALLLEGGRAELMGMKWVVVFPTNDALDLPTIHASVLVNDAESGLPLAILDGGPITAQRTAAVSGVALSEWAPRDARRVAMVGTGVQGHSHLAVLAHLCAGTELVIASRHADHAAGMADTARSTGRFTRVESTTDSRSAVEGADVVMTMVSFGPDRQTLSADSLRAARLVIAVDYDMCVPAAVATGSSLFLTDDVGQLLAARHDEVFAGYRDPDASIGQALLGEAPAARGDGPVLVSHLGVGLADVVFASAIVERARASGAGVELRR